MILTDYYRMVRLQEYANNKTPRFDTIASTGEYPGLRKWQPGAK